VESLRTGTLGVGMTMRTMLVRPLEQLGALGGLVLFIAVVNLANLILVRAVSRRAELALRATLGASRGVLVRAMAVESVLVAATGAALGVVIAVWTGRPLFNGLFGGITTLSGKALAFDLRPDLRVAISMAVVAIVIGIVCALFASWPAISRDPARHQPRSGRHAPVTGARRGPSSRPRAEDTRGDTGRARDRPHCRSRARQSQSP
jgi:hypothetical protein